jgi:hypothetical protein
MLALTDPIDRGALNRSTHHERVSRPKGPKGVSDEAFDKQEASSSGARGREVALG